MSEFVEAREALSGKRAKCVAGMIQMLIDAKGEPVAWDAMCDEVGMEHHGQLAPAMHALELVGAVKRFTYVDAGSTRPRNAYALADGVEVAS